MLKVSDIPDQVLRDIAGAYHRRLEQTLTEQQEKAERDFQRIAYLRTALEWLALWLNQSPAPVAPKDGPVTVRELLDSGMCPVPNGWALVPKEPTKAMLDSGEVALLGPREDRALNVYEAMLAAAQAQEEGK